MGNTPFQIGFVPFEGEYFLYALKAVWATISAIFLTVLLLFLAWGTGASRFSTLSGEHTYYLYSASSQAQMKTSLQITDFGKIKGESVRLTSAIDVEELLEKYSAEICFEERSAGVHSYYCYTPHWTDGVQIGEYFVNLHVAFSEGGCTVGAPIIFGGF